MINVLDIFNMSNLNLNLKYELDISNEPLDLVVEHLHILQQKGSTNL